MLIKKISNWLAKIRKVSITLFKGSSQTINKIEVLADYQQNKIKLLLNGKIASNAYMYDYFPVARLYHLYFLLPLYQQRFKKLLFIGGGGCCLPTYVYKNFPNKKVIVVEKDAILPQIATIFFSRPIKKDYVVENQEGLKFLKKNKLVQNAIYIDIGLYNSYNGMNLNSIKIYLQKLIFLSAKNLHHNGYLLINFMTTLNKSDWAWVEKHLLRPINSHFKSSFVFADSPRNLYFQDVTIVACLKKISKNDLISNLSKNCQFFSERCDLVKENNLIKNIIN